MKTQYSYSRVDTFAQCPYKYKLRYIDRLKTLPNYDDANPLIVGTALHKGLETNVETALKEYYNSFPIITDGQINEAIKLEILIPKVKALLPVGLHEVKIDCENFVGYIDLLCEDNDNQMQNIYDYKYTSNFDRYMESKQLHIYEHYRGNIAHLYYVFIPKINIRQKKTETLYDFRQRLKATCEAAKIEIREIKFNQEKVNEFHKLIDEIEHTKEFVKNETGLCPYCEYQGLCKEGVDYDII